MDVQEELRDLRHQIGEAISMGQVSVPPEKSPSFAGVSAESRRLMMPLAGGALSGAGGAPPSFMAHVTVPTEEFPGGVDLVVGCGVPPFGMRPSFIMLACFVGPLCFGIAGAAAGLGDMGAGDDGISVTEDPVMRKGALAACIRGWTSCPPTEARHQVLRLFAAAGGGMAAAAPGRW
ncbi:hypothetical protein CYMTET_41288 [Cymbomonas tetramitiformis]|uniref:Uncharacterized protein n=1 Tax=Cymbomonas tetramitiformis TaxID=36881 RepID=A0AAE0F248_9CHLO|nr:hypothetical protein CYMTET_41288 [Cymbomonas tetramitiformis]